MNHMIAIIVAEKDLNSEHMVVILLNLNVDISRGYRCASSDSTRVREHIYGDCLPAVVVSCDRQV